MDSSTINHPYPEATPPPPRRARALIGPTGYGGRFGIVWRDFPFMEQRGGYSGPFETFAEAHDRACSVAIYFEVSLEVERVGNVNDLMRDA